MRKLKPEDLSKVSKNLSFVIDPMVTLIDRAPLDCLHLPIEAFALFSKLHPHSIAQISPAVTPKLLVLFRNHHNEGQLGQELVSLFKQWSNNEDCRQILVKTFIPFIMQILQQYYKNTPNDENKATMLNLKDLAQF